MSSAMAATTIQMTPRREIRMVGKLGSVGRRPNGDSPLKKPRGGTRLDTRPRATDESGASRVTSCASHLFLDLQEPIVLRDPL